MSSSYVPRAQLGDVSPQVKARIAGVLYLIIIVGGAFAQLGVRDRLVVGGDAAATAQNIIANELLYRVGFAVEVFYVLWCVPLNIVLYDLFKIVDKKLALVMVFFSTVGAAVQAMSLLAHYAPLVFLGKSSSLAAFTTAQLQSAALISLRLFDYGYMIALSFFGMFCITLSYLILRSTFLPRFLAALLVIEGALYLTNSFTHFVAPAIGNRVFPFLLVSGIAEVSFCLWLLIVGVNARRWQAQAGASLLLAMFALVPDASAQSLDRAKLLFADAKYAEAKTELVALQRTNNGGAETAYYLGRIARIENDGDESLRQFERAVELEDGSGLYHYWYGTALSDVAQRASTARQALMARRIRKEWERAVALDPNQMDARFGLVQFYAVAPWLWGGGMDKARAQAAELAKRNAMRGAMARGVVAQHEKAAGAEVAAYQQAVALAPDSIVTYVGLADALVRAGRAEEALVTLERYAKQRPDDRWILFQTGRVVGRTGQQLDRGERALKQFLATPPSDAFVPTLGLSHYWLGQIAERRGAREAAREHYKAALTVNPRSQLSKRALEALK